MLKSAVEKQASDIFIVSGLPLSLNKHVIEPQSEEKLFPDANRSLDSGNLVSGKRTGYRPLFHCGDKVVLFASGVCDLVSVPINSAAHLLLSSVL